MVTAGILRARWRVALSILLGTGASYHLSPARDTRNESGRKFVASKGNDDTNGIPHGIPQELKAKSRVLDSEFPRPKQLRSLAHSDKEANPPADSPVETQPSQSPWDTFTSKIGVVKDSFGSLDWADLISQYLVPSWTALLPETLQTLQRELSMAKGSLADDIWSEAHDAELNPEITHEARVRIGDDLCREERYFQWRRRQAIVRGLAAYLGLREEDIHPDDVPVIALCSSGGGLRALVAGAGSYLATKQAGLWDCVMYSAGVSGTCWLQTLYHSSIGGQDFAKVIEHLKSRLGIHIAFPPDVLQQLTAAPTNKYLLRGLVEKLRGNSDSDFGLVDIYGLLLTARLLVPSQPLNLRDRDLKLSNQRTYIDNGSNPLPIYTAVRHEIPPEDNIEPDASMEIISGEHERKQKHETWFEWFEFTPYEFFCEEFAAGIPMWALGRRFFGGSDVSTSGDYSAPELRISVLMGIWGSAFCATLAHYYKEMRPVLRGLAGFGGIDSILEGKSDDLIRVHPFDPATVPNFVLGLKDKLPPTCPESVFTEPEIRLMDAGMSNNLPIYPLLRPGRHVDMIVVFDASADIKEENWLSVVEGYARQRGIKGWPIGSGWPKPETTPEETAGALKEAASSTQEESYRNVSIAQEQSQEADQATHSTDEHHRNSNASKSQEYTKTSEDSDATELTYCNIWLGTTQEQVSTDEPPPSKRLFHSPSPDDDSEADFRLMNPNAGIAVAYFPLLPNPNAPLITPGQSSQSWIAPGDTKGNPNNPPVSDKPGPIDPSRDDFMSTWNFVYTPEQVEGVVGLAKANFAEGEEQVKRVVRGIYERKRRARLERAWEGEKEGLRIFS
ncbi:hypothetical protein FQN55_005086 [Onygenales sp. PD_40]|nr:hypothetical protein FQN55_005086 [Onygenales sp. PD_40]KAK2794457.1 hypothetical protein FQN51_000821 [Onygenales sp. PD_10]